MHEELARSIAVTAVEVFRARLAPRGIAVQAEHIEHYVVEERGFGDPNALCLIALQVFLMLAKHETKAMAQFRRPRRKRHVRRGPRPVQLVFAFAEAPAFAEPGTAAA